MFLNVARCCQFVDWIQFNCVDEIFKSRTKFLWCLHRFAAEIVIFTILQWLVAMITQPNLADVVSIKIIFTRNESFFLVATSILEFLVKLFPVVAEF